MPETYKTVPNKTRIMLSGRCKVPRRDFASLSLALTFIVLLICNNVLQELGKEPVGDIVDFETEPGMGMACTVRGIEAYNIKRKTRNSRSSLIRRFEMKFIWQMLNKSMFVWP